MLIRMFLTVMALLFGATLLVPQEASAFRKVGDRIIVENDDNLTVISEQAFKAELSIKEFLARCELENRVLLDVNWLKPGDLFVCQQSEGSADLPTPVTEDMQPNPPTGSDNAHDQLSVLIESTRRDLHEFRGIAVSALCDDTLPDSQCVVEMVNGQSLSLIKIEGKLEPITEVLKSVEINIQKALERIPSGFWDEVVWPVFIGLLVTVIVAFGRMYWTWRFGE